jgi:hypothetical protein
MRKIRLFFPGMPAAMLSNLTARVATWAANGRVTDATFLPIAVTALQVGAPRPGGNLQILQNPKF